MGDGVSKSGFDPAKLNPVSESVVQDPSVHKSISSVIDPKCEGNVVIKVAHGIQFVSRQIGTLFKSIGSVAKDIAKKFGGIELEGMEHVYQGSLNPPYDKCRHAAMKMAKSYLKNVRSFSKLFVKQVFPCDEIWNGQVDTLLPPNHWPSSIKGTISKPNPARLKWITEKIDKHLQEGVPAIVYVSHTNGVHVVSVYGKKILPSGEVAYLFLEPATRIPQDTKNKLVFDSNRGNFIKEGSTNPSVKNTKLHQYSLLGVYSYMNRFQVAMKGVDGATIASDKPVKMPHSDRPS